MGTRDEAIEVLSEHLNEPVGSEEAYADFCSQFEIRPFRDGWLFQAKPKGRGHNPNPLWWMVVGSNAFGYHFFKMSNIRAYDAARSMSGALAK